MQIQQGTRNGRYEAYEPQDLGRGEFNVALSIAGLTLEDTTKDYLLRASNEFGTQDYQVRISSSEAAPGKFAIIIFCYTHSPLPKHSLPNYKTFKNVIVREHYEVESGVCS